MAQTLADIAIKLSADMVQFENDMGRAARIAKKQSNRMKRDFKIAMAAIATGAVAAGGALASLVKITANTADGIQKMSQRLGVSTEFLSQYRHVAELSGTSLEKVGDGVRKMSKSINDGNNGLSTATRAFESLGISMETLNALNPEQQFELIADRISKVESQSVKAGAAMDIFGRSGSELLTVLNAGSDGIKSMREEADRFGLTISQGAADASAEFNDELTRLGNKIQGVAESIGLSLMPSLTAMIKNVNSEEVTQGVQNWDRLNDVMVGLYAGVLYLDGAFETVGRAVGTLAGQTAQAFSIMGDLVEAFGKRVKLGALTIVDTFAQDIKEKAAILGASDMLPDFIKNSNLAKSAVELRQEIDALEGEALGLAKVFTEGIADDKSIEDAIKRYDEIQKKIKNVRQAYIKTGATVKNDFIPPVVGSTKAVEDLSGSYSEFESILASFMSPMEALNAEYARNIAAIDEYMIANEKSSDAQERAKKLIKQVTAEYINQKEALEDIGRPYRELLANLDAEILAQNATLQNLRAMDAARLLEQQGITSSNTSLMIYIGLLGQVIGKLEQIDAAQGVFGNGANTFEDLLSSAFQSGDFFKTLTEGFENAANNGAQAFADGLGSTLDFVSNALGIWEGTAGQDDAGRILDTVSQIANSGALGPVAQAIGQVASFVNQLTGGGLFGTSYEVTGSTRNLDIGAGGAGGNLQTREAGKKSWFRGTKRRTITEDLDAQTLEALNTLFENLQVAIQNSAEAVGGLAGDIITGSFSQEFDKDGNLTSQISEVLGRTYEESFEQFAQRLTAENILAGIGTVFDEVGSIAERWRSDAETLLDGSQMLLQAGADITAGNGLFGSLGMVADVIGDMQQVGESLSETYARVQGSTVLFTDALDIIGESLDIARVDFVTLATEITEAAGGLQQAQSLWSSYFETFYTEQELFERSLNNATSLRDASLGDLGLDTDISLESFRQLFETALPELSAEAVVEWLRAADAIGVVVDLEADLNAQRESNAQQLASLIGDINSEIEDMGLSPFALALKDIRKQFEAQIKTARELGASEKELAMIQAFATRQIQQAIQALENDISGALADLYGTELDQINQQIALLEQQESQIGNVQQASDNLYASQLRAIQNIGSFIDSLLLNEQLSPLNPEEQLAEAMAQFQEMLGLAQMGDLDALNALPGLAQVLLGFGQDVFASSQDYVNIFDFVTGALSELGVTASPIDPQDTIISQNSQMIALLAERNRLEAEFDASARLDAALAIAAQIADLVSVTGESFTSLAERLGIPVEEFLADLGVSLDTLTVETTLALAETAQLLGIEITDLAQSVGISLGKLADQNSLINDALEQTISMLPDGIQDTLAPLLGAIETATDPSIREELLNQMVEFIDALPADQRDLLAPYFDQIDPITEAQQQINHMAAIQTSSELMADELTALKNIEQQKGEDDESHYRVVQDKLGDLNTNIVQLVNILSVA